MNLWDPQDSQFVFPHVSTCGRLSQVTQQYGIVITVAQESKAIAGVAAMYGYWEAVKALTGHDPRDT